MPFQRPTLEQILARIRTDIEVGMGTPVLDHSQLAIHGVALGGAVHGLHGHLEWVVKQLFPSTADEENLLRWANTWGVPQLPASFASGNLILTGTEGIVVPTELELQRVDGERYLTTTGGTITGGTLTVAAKAVQAGSAGNAAAGVPVTFVSPQAGVNAQAVVATGGMAAGSDTESMESLLARVLARIQEPPHGGTDFDYRRWAREVPGVTRAFVYPKQYGLGTVGVAILADDDAHGPVAPVPLIAAVQAHVDAPDVRPVTADVTVWTPTAKPMDLSISLSPDTAEVRAAVIASLQDLLRREAEPGKTIRASKIREAVSTAAGEDDNTVELEGDFTVAPLEIAVPGEITWL